MLLSVRARLADLGAADSADGLLTTPVAGFAVLATLAEEGREATAADLADIATAATRYALARTPLQEVLDAHWRGAHLLWQTVAEELRHEPVTEVAAFVAALLSFLHRTTQAIVAAYRLPPSDEVAARERLRTVLLSGQDPAEHAELARFPLSRSYNVIAFRVEGSAGADIEALHPRAVESLQRLEGDAAVIRLTTFDGRGGIILQPSNDPHPAHAVIDSLATTLAAPVTATMAGAEDFPAIPAARQLAEDLLELARGLDRAPALYQLSDLMVEYQITRPGPARDALEAAITPLLGHPHLLEALRVNLRYGLDRQSASKALGLHPNSYSYRLQRIAELTGFDATDAAAARVLSAAILVTSVLRDRPN
ncbi:PucR family transcriptional regulator [Nocardia tengchongensis]|uniref:PucR family transcriptional regulator n=1 Tax=Nocardia tengchongensis TaxID=2055889 RepID=UPI00369F815A